MKLSKAQAIQTGLYDAANALYMRRSPLTERVHYPTSTSIAFEPTIHGIALHFIPPIVPVDFELEILIRRGDLLDLVLFIDEVADVPKFSIMLIKLTVYAASPELLQISRKDRIRREILSPEDEHCSSTVASAVSLGVENLTVLGSWCEKNS